MDNDERTCFVMHLDEPHVRMVKLLATACGWEGIDVGQPLAETICRLAIQRWHNELVEHDNQDEE